MGGKCRRLRFVRSRRGALSALGVLVLGVTASSCALFVPTVQTDGRAAGADEKPAGEEKNCTRAPGEGRDDRRPLKRTVKLTPDVPGHVVNFGGSRDYQFIDVVLTAKPALPRSVQRSEIRLEVLRRLARTSENLGTASAPKPTFTKPDISQARDRVTFTVCLPGEGLEPGSYAGSVLVEGPRGLAPTAISITENAKDSDLAKIGTALALVAALLFLVLRGAAARQAKDEEARAKALTEAAEEADPNRRRTLQGKAPQPKDHIWKYLGGVFADLNWIVTTLVALGLAFGSIYGIYSADPSWGADKIGSVIALVGPAFTAVGVQSVVTSLGRGVGR